MRTIRASKVDGVFRPGAVAMELALILPVLLMLILGIIEVGRAMMVRQIVTSAAREGARRAIIPGATDDEVLGMVDDYLVGSTLGAASRNVQILDADNEEVSIADVPLHEIIQIRVTVPYDEVGIGLASWMADWDMVASVRMRKEQ
jgi:hypothetical protein